MYENLKAAAAGARELISELTAVSNEKKTFEAQLAALAGRYQKENLAYLEYVGLQNKLFKDKTEKEWLEHYDTALFALVKKIEQLNSEILYYMYSDRSFETPQLVVVKKPVEEKPAVATAAKPAMPAEAAKLEQQARQAKRAEPEGQLEQGTVAKQAVPAEEPKKAVQLKPEGKWLKPGKPKEQPVPEKTAVAVKPSEPEAVPGHIKLFPGRENVGVLKERLAQFEAAVRAPKHEPTAAEIAEEFSRIERTVRKKNYPVYTASKLGRISSPLVSRLSDYIIARYPAFFRRFSNILRLGNVQVLSRTYLNILVFLSIFSYFFAVPLVMSILLFNDWAWGSAATASAMAALIFPVIVALAFYLYPYAVVEKRKKEIKDMLPFAVNHISAIASSGIEPAKMLSLVAESKEYGAICDELRRIVEFVDIFGYDLLTAVRTVSLTSPCPEFKEFLQGMISSIESGGDLVKFLKDEVDISMNEYELERQRYSHLMETFSDVYTGIMLAAPLFFIITLSLISIMGGVIGGMSASTLIILGTYVLVPLINVLFIVFLEVTSQT